MGKYSKLREKILAGGSDGNVEFAEIINSQPKGNKSKPYQVKQVRSILVKYRLGESDVD